MSNPVIIKCVALSGLTYNPASVPVGQFLARYDVNAMDGRGMAEWTHDPLRAMTFVDQLEALQAWQAQSRVRPYRSDGEPNRPLTAYTVEVVRLAEAS